MGNSGHHPCHLGPHSLIGKQATGWKKGERGDCAVGELTRGGAWCQASMEKERELSAESTCCVTLIQMTFGLSILVKDLKPHTLARWAEIERITTVESSFHTVLVTFLIDETRQKHLQGGRSQSCSQFARGVHGGTRQFPTPRQMGGRQGSAITSNTLPVFPVSPVTELEPKSQSFHSHPPQDP